MAIKFIAGPCVIESAELLDTVAERLTAINRTLGMDIIFKASFDKANRTIAGVVSRCGYGARVADAGRRSRANGA